MKPTDIALQLPGLQVDETFRVIPAFVADIPQASLAALAMLPTVRYVSPDGAVQVLPARKPSKEHSERA